MSNESAVIFNIQRFCVHDGPGIRTTVFLKGCPLRCQWCDNPESMNSVPELGFAAARCNKCGKCAGVCPEGAIEVDDDGMPGIDRKRCTACGECVPVCIPEALAIYGKRWTLDEVVEEARKDEGFYGSDGGVTVSGGEPLAQPSFVTALLKRCHLAGISTAIETSGYAPRESLKQVLNETDVVMFDLKHMDSVEHRKLTGKSNESILKNARLVAGRPHVQFRIPLIPGKNSDPENIRATAEFLREMQGTEASIELMPYHRLGKGKYEALGRPYPLEDLGSLDTELVESVQQAFEQFGVRCLVSR
ncbi:glycyl-radical enzyme activating protein [Chloroflexota bacterium]